jgi:hypothetical protein
MAVVYVNQERFAEALDLLKLAREAIPQIYDIREREGLLDVPEAREQQVYWLILGQVELQYALCAFGQKDYTDACVRLLRAFACILAFSHHATQLNVLRRLGRRELAEIQDKQRLEELRTETFWSAQQLRIGRDAIVEMETLFDEAAENIDLL